MRNYQVIFRDGSQTLLSGTNIGNAIYNGVLSMSEITNIVAIKEIN